MFSPRVSLPLTCSSPTATYASNCRTRHAARWVKASATAAVELASLVVEPVRELVAHHHADGAVVHHVRGRGHEEGRLQDARREHDLIEGRVVVRVHGRRRDPPFRAINRASDLVELSP